MANWCNARLIVIGARDTVAAFVRRARARPTSVFRGDMLVGETQELRAERQERVNADISRKVYLFQVRNDDGAEHFRRLSQRYRSLTFVLVYGDPNADAYGSYCLKAGLARAHRLSQRQEAAVMRKHGVTVEDEDEWRFWEASWELMDLAEAKWARMGARSQPARRPPSRARNGRRTSTRRARAGPG